MHAEMAQCIQCVQPKKHYALVQKEMQFPQSNVSVILVSLWKVKFSVELSQFARPGMYGWLDIFLHLQP